MNKQFTIQKNHNFSIPKNSEKNNFVITKKITKHGSQAIIVVPKILEEHLKPGTIVELRISIIKQEINLNFDRR